MVHRFRVYGKEPFLAPLEQCDSFSFADPETSPTFNLEEKDRGLYLVSTSGKRMLCCTLPASVFLRSEWMRPRMKFFKNTVVIGCSDGLVVLLRISM